MKDLILKEHRSLNLKDMNLNKIRKLHEYSKYVNYFLDNIFFIGLIGNIVFFFSYVFFKFDILVYILHGIYAFMFLNYLKKNDNEWKNLVDENKKKFTKLYYLHYLPSLIFVSMSEYKEVGSFMFVFYILTYLATASIILNGNIFYDSIDSFLKKYEYLVLDDDCIKNDFNLTEVRMFIVDVIDELENGNKMVSSHLSILNQNEIMELKKECEILYNLNRNGLKYYVSPDSPFIKYFYKIDKINQEKKSDREKQFEMYKEKHLFILIKNINECNEKIKNENAADVKSIEKEIRLMKKDIEIYKEKYVFLTQNHADVISENKEGVQYFQELDDLSKQFKSKDLLNDLLNDENKMNNMKHQLKNIKDKIDEVEGKIINQMKELRKQIQEE